MPGRGTAQWGVAIPPSVLLRPAAVDDVAAVPTLWAEAGAHPTTTDDTASVSTLLARDPDALLVAEIDGGLVGTLIVGWDGWRGNMYRLAVLPAYRRRGIATALVAAALRRLETLGCRRITALVAAGDAHAVDFWTAVGFTYQDMDRYVLTLNLSATR
jgi:ribosomal protein S18 acetylase RimI-like enzyme